MLSKLLLSIVAIGCVATSANAQSTPNPPDPATVTVPEIGALDQKTIDQGYKFFIFKNPSISFADAYADIAECRSFLPVGVATPVPGFIPWLEPNARPKVVYAPIGLAMGIAADIIMPKMERGARNNKMRRCMGTRGYRRYAVPEAVWKQLNEGDELTLIAMQAKLATGPATGLTEVLP